MVSRFLRRGALATLAGAAMLAAISTPAPAFTLSSLSLDQPGVSADLEPVYWHHGWGGGWHHGWGWHRGWGWGHPGWGWGHPGWGWRGPVYHPWRRCWWGPWGYRCHWY